MVRCLCCFSTKNWTQVRSTSHRQKPCEYTISWRCYTRVRVCTWCTDCSCSSLTRILVGGIIPQSCYTGKLAYSCYFHCEILLHVYNTMITSDVCAAEMAYNCKNWYMVVHGHIGKWYRAIVKVVFFGISLDLHNWHIVVDNVEN